MSKIKCPKCGSDSILTERRLDGFHTCLECLHRWKIGESQPKQTVFDRLTTSPEVLAEKMVYQSGRFKCRQWNPRKGGWSDPSELWRSTLIPCCNFDYEAEAIAATVAKLKEPE